MFEKYRTTVEAMPGSRFGGYTPKSDPRVKFSLCRVGDKLFFLNQTPQILDNVTNTSFGIVSTDDDGGIAPTSSLAMSYEMVLPGEAVLIDEFDAFFDLDSVIYMTIEVQVGGDTQIFKVSAKGGANTKVLQKYGMDVRQYQDLAIC